MSHEIPYRNIARYYDRYFSYVDYAAYGRYLFRLLAKHGADPKQILELGAGTCPLARDRIFPHGIKVVYSDLSPAMLSQAPADPPISRVAADAMALPFKGPFDLCLMVYDGINYLLEKELVLRCLAEAFRVLAPGCLFLFDVVTAATARNYEYLLVDYTETEGVDIIRQSGLDRETSIQCNTFTFFIEGPEGYWRKVQERHEQRVYALATWRTMARQAGFTVEAIYTEMSFEPGSKSSLGLQFVLRKPVG